MALTTQEVEKIAELARLGISEEEKEKFRGELSLVIGYIEKLSEVNIENVKPMTGGTILESVVREDDGSKCISDSHMREQILNATPNREGDYVKVPSILN